MRASRPALAFVVLLHLACSRTIDGPTPSVTAVVNPADEAHSPATLCNAQGVSSGWRLEVRGEGFSPLPLGALTGSSAVALPSVTLTGPSTLEVPAERVAYDGAGLLLVDVPTQELPPGLYSVTVQNPNGNAAVASDALRVVPPPALVKATAPSGFAQGAPNELVIEGSGFRSDAPPSVELMGEGLATVALTEVTVRSDGEVSAIVPVGTPAGSYEVRLRNPEGCEATLSSAVSIAYGVLGTLTVQPRFGWQLRNQAITIFNSPSATEAAFSGGAPEVFITAPLKSNPAQPVDVRLQRVAFVSPSFISAIVPTCSGLSALPLTDATCPDGIVAGGPYPLSVRDPSGATGTLASAGGFVVLAAAPPSITALSPSTIDTSGLPSSIATELVVTGANFGAGAKLQLLQPLGAGRSRACDLPMDQATATELRATVPTSYPAGSCVDLSATGTSSAATVGLMLTPGLYVVRAQNSSDPAYADFSGLVVTTPSANPTPGPAIDSRLIAARAEFPLVVATNDVGEPFLYAAGGFGAGGALASVERAPLTPFGDVGDFAALDRTPLTTARRGLRAIVRTVPGDTSYVFVLGGQTQAGIPIAAVERAQVLKTSDAPALKPLSAVQGTLAAGSWYYRVSAISSASDPSNPDGETLPSDELPFSSKQSAAGASLSWACVANAQRYRVYRTATVNAPSGTEVLLAETTACAFVDDGTVAPGTERPLPNGALGKWVAVSPLTVPRAHAAALLYADRLFVSGGTTNGGTVLNTVEVASFAGSTAQLGSFTALSSTMPVPRRKHAMTVADVTSAPSSFTTTANNRLDAWLMNVGGNNTSGIITTNVVDLAKISDASGAVASPPFAASSYNVSGMHGGWSLAIANILFAVGDGGGGNLRAKSNYVCRQGAGPGPCASANSFNATLNDTGGIIYGAGAGTRFDAGVTLFRAYIYVAGGTSGDNSTAPLDTLDRIIF